MLLLYCLVLLLEEGSGGAAAEPSAEAEPQPPAAGPAGAGAPAAGAAPAPFEITPADLAPVAAFLRGGLWTEQFLPQPPSIFPEDHCFGRRPGHPGAGDAAQAVAPLEDAAPVSQEPVAALEDAAPVSEEPVAALEAEALEDFPEDDEMGDDFEAPLDLEEDPAAVGRRLLAAARATAALLERASPESRASVQDAQRRKARAGRV